MCQQPIRHRRAGYGWVNSCFLFEGRGARPLHRTCRAPKSDRYLNRRPTNRLNPSSVRSSETLQCGCSCQIVIPDGGKSFGCCVIGSVGRFRNDVDENRRIVNRFALSDGGISVTSAIRLAGDHRLPADHSWVVLDVETSGMRAASHRVLSIAALVLREDGSVEREFSTLLDPGCDPGPVHVHNLTPDRLAGAPRFEDIADEFGELLSGRTMVAHNASFDYGFLDAEFQRAGFGTPIEKRLCTLALSRRLELDVPNHRLATLAEYWKIEQVNAHDAYDDARLDFRRCSSFSNLCSE